MKRRKKAAALAAIGAILSLSACTDDDFQNLYGPPPENMSEAYTSANNSTSAAVTAPNEYKDANGDVVEDDAEYDIIEEKSNG